MKKFILIIFLMLLPMSIFAHNFYLINVQLNDDLTERVYLTRTQEVAGAQYSVIIADENWNVSWIASFHSSENNDNMQKFAEKVFKNYKWYKTEFKDLGLEETGRFTNNALIINSLKCYFNNSLQVKMVTFFE